MIRQFRLGTLFASSLLVGACAQLIGLDDYETVSGNSDAGDDGGGKGGKGGTAGTTTAGDAGTGGKGGAGSGGKSDAGGQGGGEGGAEGGSKATGGKGGKGGEVGEPGGAGGEGGRDETGGASGTSGTSGSGGTSGTSGAGGCTELTAITYISHQITPLSIDFPAKTIYFYEPTPSLGLASDTINFEFYAGLGYDGDSTGTFNLGLGDDSNYESCSRCVYASSDGGDKEYFQESGEMLIDSASEQMTGAPDLTLRDVKLVEVVINAQLHSTPVPGGRCLHIQAADVYVPTPLPPEWTCSDADYRDEYCDCGCGAPDPACESAYGGACDYCGLVGSCTDDDYCTGLNVLDNSLCTDDGIDWAGPLVCSPKWYGDASCDCGCGAPDIDCASPAATECLFCWCIAVDGNCADPNGVTADDNAQCD